MSTQLPSADDVIRRISGPPSADDVAARIAAETAPQRLPPSQPFLDRLSEGADSLNAVLKAIGTDASSAFGKGAREGFGSEPIGLGPESEKWLRERGIIADPANGKGGPLRLLNEAIIRPAAALGDTLARGINAGVVGMSSVVGKRVEQVTGDETAGKQAKREAQNFANWVLLEGGGVLTTLRVTPSGLQEVPLGGLPWADDFVKVADTIGTPEAKGLIKKLYDEHGIHPAEVAADAMTDVTIVQDLAAGKLPGYYTKNPEAGKGPPLSIREAQQAELPPPGDVPPPKPDPIKGELVSRDATDVLDPNAPKPDVNIVPYEEARQNILSKISKEQKPNERLTFDQLYTRLVDDLNPVKTALQEAGFTNLAAGDDPYVLYRLTRGSFGKADQMLLNHTYNFKDYGRNGQSLKDILAPLGGDLDDFRVYIAAKRAVELEARGIKSGFGVDSPVSVIDHLAAQSPQYERIQKELVGYQNKLSLYLRDSGLISQDAYKAMLEANQNYVPFFRFTDPTLVPRGGTGKGLSARNPIKKIEGDGADIIDPIESIIRNTYAYVQLAEKNDASLKLIQLLRRWNHKAGDMPLGLPKPGDEGVFYGRAPGSPAGEALQRSPDQLEAPKLSPLGEEIKRLSDEVEGVPLVEKFEPPALKDAHYIDAEFEEVFNSFGIKNRELKEVFSSFAREPSGNEIFAFENGKRVSMKVSDPELLNSWRQLDRHSANFLTQILAAPSRVLRGGVTLEPTFMVRNFIGDFFSAVVNTKGAIFSPIDTARGMAGIYKALKGRPDVDFQNWLKGGGANGTMVSLDRRYVQEQVEFLAQKTDFMDKVWNEVTLKDTYRRLQMMSEFLENSTRLGEFKKLAGAKKFGADPAGTAAGKGAIQAAAMASREVTLDFARIGSQTRAYSMVTAFANAQIQGIDRFFRAMKENPWKTTIAAVGGISVPSVLLWAANREDPRYKRLPDWEKDLFWHFMTEDTIYRMRKPLGPAGIMFGAGIERALDAFAADNPRSAASLAGSVLASFAPAVIPTVAVPVLEQMTNRSSFSGGPIIPASMEDHLPEYQYTEYTTETAKKIGSLLGAFPGMREWANNRSAPLNGVAQALTSPELIENYIRGWTGSLGMTILKIADFGLRKTGNLPDPPKPEDTLADLPFFKSFVARYPSSGAQPITDFYNMNSANERVMNTLATRAKSGDQQAYQDIADNYGFRLRLDAAKQTLGDMAAAARMIYKDPSMTPTDKRQQLDTIFMRRIEIAEFYVKLLREDEKRREQDMERVNQIKAYERQQRLPAAVPATDPRRLPVGGGTVIQAPPAPRQQPERAGEIRLP